MLFKPAQLGMAKLGAAELEADKKACKKIGPCGVGKKALYLNSFYIDRRYYLPYGSISRVFKRVAMSSGGFTGKGMFASMAYLVVEYDGGKQKQCNFKDERDVDKLLEVLAKEQPQIHLLSAAGEQMLQKKEAEKASRKLPELTKDAEHSLTVLRRAKEYLEAKPEIADELSAAERRKRAQLQSKPVYRYVALAIFLFGLVAAAYGLYAITNHVGNYGIYFALFGFAAIFLFSSYNMLPTAHNNHSAIMKRADRAEKAEAAMAEYVKHYPNGAFPVPSHYAHPIVLKQMADAIEEGRAVTVPEALEAVKARLKSLNADVQVEQEEYDEVVVIKAMFLNHQYA
ncbi:ATPase P [Faecalibacterium prausnitzii]|uniref:ATPase P n=1 Tax=Faecalibacterium prausnitzii TaxID=853 RepID=UPI003C2F5227